MSVKTTASFLSSDGVHNVHVDIWRPEGDPWLLLQLSHGMCEYAGRYDGFARWMAGHGILVCANDHLGHGHTAEPTGDFGFFAEKNGRELVLADLKKVNDSLRAAHPTLPLVLLGHSMGSFFARWFAECHSGALEGLVLSGTGGPSATISAGKRLAGLLRFVCGPRSTPALLGNLSFGRYNKRIDDPSSPNAWLTRDGAVVAAYDADPFCTFPFTASAYCDLLWTHRHVNRPAWANSLPKDLPILLFSGEEDPVGDYGKGVKKAADLLLAAGMNDVTCRLYPGGRHEMLNEINREEVYADLLGWLEAHYPH